jgi:hypothetical protein
MICPACLRRAGLHGTVGELRIMMQEKVVTNVLLKSGERDTSRGAEYVAGAFDRYGVTDYAVLVDHTSVPEDLPARTSPAGPWSWFRPTARCLPVTDG